MRVKESETFVDVGGYVYHNEGQAKIKLHVGEVNKPLRPDDAEKIQKLKKIRVYMGVTEDKSVHGNQVYEKEVNMWQEPNTKDEKTKPSDYEEDVPTYPDANTSPYTKGEAFLKNMVDKIKDNILAIWIVLVGFALLIGYTLLR